MATSDIGIRIGLQGAETVTSGLQRVQASMGQLSGQVDTVRTALSTLAPTLAGALSVGGLVAFVRSTVNAIDAMNDLADATGASIEEISKLDQVARRNGASLDQVGSMLVKFNAQLKEADGKNGASIALQAIGLEAAKLRQLDPAEALRQTAVALAGFADDANKARITQELFGKSVRDAAPFLNDLAEAGELNASVTAQQADEAAKFNKQLFAFQANAGDAARVITQELLPTLSAIAAEFNRVNTAGDSLAKFFGTGLKVVLETLAVLAADVAFVFRGVGRDLGGIAAQIAALAKGDFAGFSFIRKALIEDSIQARKELDALQARILGVQNTMRAADAARSREDRGFVPGGGRSVIDIAAEQARRRAADESALKAAKDRQTELDILAKRQLANIVAYDKAEAELEEQLKRSAKAELELAATRGMKAVEAYEASEQAIDANLVKAKDLVDAINRETEALQMSNIERETSAALLELERAGLEKGTYAYDEYAKKIREAVLNRETVRASIEQTKTIEQEWRRTADQIGQSLTDALMTGGKSAWEYIKGLFRSMVLRPVIQAIVNPIVGSLGGGGGGALSTLGSINSLASLGSAITGSFTGSIANVIGSAGTTFGSSALTAFSAGMKGATLAPGLMGPTTAGAGGAMGAGASVAAAVPYVAAALAVANALGVFRSKRVVGGGLIGTLGAGDIESYDLQRRGGTLFSGPEYSLVNQKLSTESQAIQAAYEALRTNAANMAESLGLSGDAVRNFTTRLGNDVLQNDLSARGIKLDGLTPEQAAAKVQEALGQANEDLAAFILGASRIVTETLTTSVESWSETEQGRVFNGFVDQVSEVTRTIEATGVSYRREGETNVQTLQRLAGSLGTINPALDQLGLNLYATSLAGADLASQLADAFGNLENFTQATAGYYAEFYTEAERTAKTTEQLTEALGGLGISLPTTRDAYRQLVEAQDLNTEAGRKNFAALVQLSGTFAGITPVVEDLADAGDTATETLRSAADILRERQSLERQLLQLQGDTAALRALDRAALDESNRALYDRITALQDSQAAEATAAEATRTAAAAAEEVARVAAAETQRIGQERLGLERQLLQLQGDTATIRALERAALDESNRALFDRITALQDSQAAEAAAAQATRTAVAAAEEAARAAAAETQRIGQERLGLERQLLQLQGDTATIRALERAALDASNRALFDQIQALQDTQAAAQAAAQAESDLAGARQAAARDFAATKQRQADEASASTDVAFALVRRAIEAQAETARAALTQAFDAQIQAIQRQQQAATASRDAAAETLRLASDIFKYLGDQIADLRGAVGAGMSAAAAQRFIGDAITAARATGVLPDQAALAQAVGAARGGLSAANFATAFEQRRATLLLAGSLQELQDVAGVQMSTAERALRVSEDQLAALEDSSEQARTLFEQQTQAIQDAATEQLAAAQAQVDLLRNVDTRLLTVGEALRELSGAISAEQTARAAAAAAQTVAASTAVPRPAGSANRATVTRSKDQLEAMMPGNWYALEAEQKIAWINAQRVSVEELKQFGTSPADIAWMLNNGYKGFANGGMHMGGLRLVGERGPELEVTGPARYWSFNDTQAMLSDPKRREEVLSAEIRELRAENAAQARGLVQMQARMNKVLERWDADGMPETRVVS